MSDILVKCLNPVKVRNPTTGEIMLMPCGKCKACRLSRSYYYTTLCRTEATVHTNTYFVTLTYDDQHIPRASFVLTDNGQYDLVDLTTGLVVSDHSVDESEVYKLRHKVRCNDIPYLLKYDVQLFIKRLRKVFGSNKIRYFAVGEYGPKHFRPHYHLLLWFDNDPKQLYEIVSEKWSSGRVDVQKATGDCAQYVTGYTSSFSFVPPALCSTVSSPFVLHSSKLGLSYFFGYFGKVYGVDYDRFSTMCIEYDGGFKKLPFLRTFKSACWFKCRRYDALSVYDRLRAFTIYRCVAKDVPLKNQAVAISNHLFNIYSGKTCKSRYDYAIKHFISTLGDIRNMSYDQVHGVVYRDLLLSKRFCTIAETDYFIRQVGTNYGQYPDCYTALYYEIDRFLQYSELKCLSLFYECQDKIIRKYDVPIDYFYDQNFYKDHIKETLMYQDFLYDTEKRYSDSTKHKYLNDVNKILYG